MTINEAFMMYYRQFNSPPIIVGSSTVLWALDEINDDYYIIFNADKDNSEFIDRMNRSKETGTNLFFKECPKVRDNESDNMAFHDY